MSAILGGIRKRLNKTGQYFSEKFGRAKPTALDEEFLAMEKRVASTEKLVDEIIASIDKFLYPNPAVRAKMRAASAFSRIIRRNRDVRSAQHLPEAKVGETMLARVEAFEPRENGPSNIRHALETYGNAFKSLADLRHAFQEHVTNNFIKPLGDTKKDLAEIHTIRHKLEGRRLDYDGRKRKKNNGEPVSEDELKQAEERYEQTKKLAREAMKNFIERDSERVTALKALRDEMIDFNKQSINILQRLGPEPAAATTTNKNNLTTSSAHSAVTTKQVDAWGDEGHSYTIPKNVVIPTASPPPPPTSVPHRIEQESENPFAVFYRALYDCVPGEEEPASLAFKEGDIITFVEECDDKQWFFGSCNGQSGYIPYNYVQIIEELPQV